MARGNHYDDYSSMAPAQGGATVTTTVTTIQTCRAVYIGVSQSLDFYMGSDWVTFSGLVAGSIIPVQASGVRKNTGPAACDANDVVFLY